MIPNINPRGHSFLGVTAYLVHDKGALTSERVGETATHNLHTDDIHQAANYMAWVDKNRDFLKAQSGGSRCGAPAHAGNTYHYSLAWKTGEERTWEDMHLAAQQSVEMFELQGHQWFVVQHTDEPQPHVHVVVNLVNPETGIIHQPANDHFKIDRWANEYEIAQGDVQCHNRAKKYESWDQDRDAFKDTAKKIDHGKTVTEAFERSDSGKAFVAALEIEGLALAKGKRRTFVIIDRHGDISSLSRVINFDAEISGRKKTRAINDRLKDLDREALRDAGTLSSERKHFDRDAGEVSQQHALNDAAELAAQKKAETAKQVQQKERALERARRKEEKQRRESSWRAFVARKTKESRSRWQIDELTQAKSSASAELAQVSGFWSRIFKRRAFLERKDHLQDMTLRLEERTERFEADIQAVSKGRKTWMAERVQKKRERPAPARSVEQKPPSEVKQEFTRPHTPAPSPMSPEERRLASKQAYLDRMAERRKDRGPDRDFGRE